MKHEAMTRWVLRRLEDQKYFQDAFTNEERSEWSANIEDARAWVDHDSCCAAASTWLAVKGEPLEVIQRGC